MNAPPLPRRATLQNIPALSKSLASNIIRLHRHRKAARRPGADITAIILTGRLGDICAAHAVLPLVASPGRRLLWLAKPRYAELLTQNPAIHGTIPVTSHTEARLLHRLFPDITFIDLHVDKSACELFNFSIRNPNRQGITIDNFYHFGTLADVYCLIAAGQPATARPTIHADTSFDIPAYLAANLTTPQNPVLALHAVSEEAQRSWQAAQTNALANQILRDTNFNICEFGQKPLLTPAARVATVKTACTLPQQAALIAHSKLFIGVDSAFAHLANAFAVPSILLLGDYRNFANHIPWHLHPNDIILRTKGNAANITIAQVTAALTQIRRIVDPGESRGIKSPFAPSVCAPEPPRSSWP